MQRIGLVVVPLRAFLVMAFGLLVVFQTLSLPGQWSHMAKESPEHADLRWPLTVFSVVELLCVEIVVVCTWKLLTLVKNDRIFTNAALVWVDVIVWAIAAAWVLLAGLFLYLAPYDDPGFPMLMMVVLVGGAVLGLLMVVMRALLQQATTLRSDMDEVI